MGSVLINLLIGLVISSLDKVSQGWVSSSLAISPYLDKVSQGWVSSSSLASPHTCSPSS